MVLVEEEIDPMRLQVLVIGCEPTFLNNVTQLLHLLNHKVWIYQNPSIAFGVLRVRKNFYDLIITDLYLGEMDGFQVQKTNREEFKLPLIIVSADDRDHVILKALKLGAAHYVVKPICFDDVKDLWQFVPNRFPKKHSFLDEEVQNDISNEDRNVGNNATLNLQRRKTMKELVAPKKAKLMWTQELQARFLEAINFIGLERAVPKSILEIMNIDGLTRENVASHLQKYRQYLRRVAIKISLSKSTFGWQSSTSIFQQHPILAGQNIYMNLGYPLFNSNKVHQASSSSSSAPSLSYHPNSLSNFQLPQAPLSSFMGPTSQNGSGEVVQAITNEGLQQPQTSSSSSLVNNNNPSMISHLGFPYNEGSINNSGLSSWNEEATGFTNDSNGINNNNYYDGLPMITSPASLDLTGFNSTTSNPNYFMVVENVNDFGSVVLNNTDDQIQDVFNASSEGDMVFSDNNISGVEDGSASLVGFGDFTTNGEAMANSSSDDNFDDLLDILFSATDLEPVVNNEEAGNEMFAAYETSASLVAENASFFLTEVMEPNRQNSNIEVVVEEEPEFDWLDLLDASTVLENVTLDEDLKNFMDSMLNGSNEDSECDPAQCIIHH